jgi:hypothetical protein
MNFLDRMRVWSNKTGLLKGACAWSVLTLALRYGLTLARTYLYCSVITEAVFNNGILMYGGRNHYPKFNSESLGLQVQT